MENPFSFSGVVKDESFCDRKQEQADLKKFINSSQNVVLYSHRRFGKTSLILKVLENLKSVTPVYIDLYGITSVEDFISATFKGISTIESRVEKLMKLVKEKISRLTVNFSIDVYTGAPVAIPSFAAGDKSLIMEEVFGLIDSLSRKKKIVIAFDEFQEVAKFGGHTFEKQLRKVIQNHDRISYIFCGSQKHILHEMFLSSKKAFYKLATSYSIKQIETREYRKWINGLFKKDGRKIGDEFINRVVKRCKNQPRYIQEFFFHLWGEFEIRNTVIDRIEYNILEHRESEYINIWEALTLNQRKALKLVVLTEGKNIFSSNALSQVGLKTASQATRGLDMLVKREVVSKNGIYSIQDVFLELWLRRRVSG